MSDKVKQDLLEALKQAVWIIENAAKDHHEDWWLNSEYERAKAVIANAEKPRAAMEQKYLDAAKSEREREGELEIDDDAVVSISDDGGAYVQGWVWISDTDIEEPLSTPCGSMTLEELKEHVEDCEVCSKEFPEIC